MQNTETSDTVAKVTFNIPENVTSNKPIPEDLRFRAEELYKNMVNDYFSTRSMKYLSPAHHKDFIEGVWRSVQQLRKEGITKQMIEQELNAKINSRAVDIANDVISANVVFFLTDFNGEEQAHAEVHYHDLIKDFL